MTEPKRQVALVQHVLQSIERLKEYALTPMARENFARDWIAQSALLYVLQTMSESLQQLEPDLRQQFPAIPWKQIRAFRNAIAHGYLGELDHDIVWQVINGKLDDIEEAMRKFLEASHESR